MAEVYLALEMGLRDYCRKNGIERVYLGLSGGIDSTLVATLACDAIGADNVYGISNPSAYSSEHSRTDAAELAERTGLNFCTVPIAPAVDAFCFHARHRRDCRGKPAGPDSRHDLDGRVESARPIDRAGLRQQERAGRRLQHDLR